MWHGCRKGKPSTRAACAARHAQWPTANRSPTRFPSFWARSSLMVPWPLCAFRWPRDQLPARRTWAEVMYGSFRPDPYSPHVCHAPCPFCGLTGEDSKAEEATRCEEPRLFRGEPPDQGHPHWTVAGPGMCASTPAPVGGRPLYANGCIRPASEHSADIPWPVALRGG